MRERERPTDLRERKDFGFLVKSLREFGEEFWLSAKRESMR